MRKKKTKKNESLELKLKKIFLSKHRSQKNKILTLKR